MMKKVFYILIVTIFLVSGMQITMSRHFCGGKLAEVKISFSGEKGSCGMVHNDNQRNNELAFGVRCCEDFQSVLTVTNNYFPQFFQLNIPQTGNQTIFFRNTFLSEIQIVNPDFYSTGYPPGNLRSGLTQPEICVFRI
jgi:hypothetical protein